MEKVIGETGKYYNINIKVIERSVDESNSNACMGCIFSGDDSRCGIWDEKEARRIMGVCHKKDRTDRKSVVFINADDKHPKTEEFRQYALKHVPTKVLLKEFFRKMRYVYKYGLSMNSRPYHSDSGDYCDPRCSVIVGRFASWNPYKGSNFRFYYTLAEIKAELDTREHII